jgi:hypothetical protein
MDDIEEINYKDHRIEIDIDPHPINPREHFNVTTFSSQSEYVPDEAGPNFTENHEIVASKPLYIYDHSGVTISTSPFRSHWDSGQIGYVYITEEAVEESGVNRDILDDVIEAEVETFDQYLRGEVYSHVALDPDGDVVGSCGGFYDKSQAIKEAKGIIDHRVKKRREKQHEKLQAMIENNVPLDKRQEELDNIKGAC